MTPFVSILIDSYNYARFLRQAIDSALTQTYRNLEVVVVDDGSTDESWEVICSYGDRIVPLLKENGGQGSAFNAGFAKTRGEIVMFLDSDDYLAPNAAERIVAHWKSDTQAVHHRVRVVDKEGKGLGFWPSEEYPVGSGDVVPDLLRTGTYQTPPTSGVAYSRALLQKLLPVSENFRLSADAWLVFQAPFYTPITGVDETLAYYRVHGANPQGNGWPRWNSPRKTLESFVKIWDLSHGLVAEQAKKRGLPLPDLLAWESSYSMRWKLIVARLHGAPAEQRAQFARDAIKKIKSERHTPEERWKQIAVVYAVWRGPDWLLRRMFPNMFAP